ncbi:MAG: hypothetical protein JKY20_06035 [Alphaproteobacteria bacterium]|nr:hypothetical protein [Alphaproteobacteria bacterium]
MNRSSLKRRISELRERYGNIRPVLGVALCFVFSVSALADNYNETAASQASMAALANANCHSAIIIGCDGGSTLQSSVQSLGVPLPGVPLEEPFALPVFVALLILVGALRIGRQIAP